MKELHLFLRFTCRRMQSFCRRWTANWTRSSRCDERNIKSSSSEL